MGSNLGVTQSPQLSFSGSRNAALRSCQHGKRESRSGARRSMPRASDRDKAPHLAPASTCYGEHSLLPGKPQRRGKGLRTFHDKSSVFKNELHTLGPPCSGSSPLCVLPALSPPSSGSSPLWVLPALGLPCPRFSQPWYPALSLFLAQREGLTDWIVQTQCPESFSHTIRVQRREVLKGYPAQDSADARYQLE